MNQPHNLYFHIPYCASKCHYCAFFSTACVDPDWNSYRDGILSEIQQWADKMGKIDVPTIFFGGGTPSLMPVNVFSQIMDAIRKAFNVLPDCEITLESNPGTLDKDKLRQFAEIGMNRLSIGVQSLNDENLRFLGRRHSVQDARDLIRAAQNMGLRVSADFIYGLPGQCVEDIRKMCRDINELGLNHCSMYELTIEDGTPFAKMNLDMPNNDIMAEMYDAIMTELNLPRYEVSNYAATGFECRHNQNIWDGQPYIGFGRGAAGRPLINNIWYEQMGQKEKLEKMNNKDRAIEKVIMGLRTGRGVELTPYVTDAIDMYYVYTNPEFFVVEDQRLSVTNNGLMILNDLLVKLVK